MLLQPILSVIILSSVRKSLKKTGLLQKWYRVTLAGSVVFIALIVLDIVLGTRFPGMVWLAHALTFGLVYMVYTHKDFSSAKSITYAFLPLIILNFIEDLVKVVDPAFYKNWENYFDAGGTFGFLWMVAMVIIISRQKKALEKEKLKAEEKEKEYKITEIIKAELEVQVNERTAELTKQKEELQVALNELKATQSQLIQSEKMASLGELTAGIAHEIQNPLNFVNNFSEINKELLTEMQEEIEKGNYAVVNSITKDIISNEEKIMHHGKRADSIVKGMLQHSRSSSGVKEPTDINALCDEYLRLAYHGLRAKDKSFNAEMKTDFDENIGMINIVPQDIGRVILNLITNAFYAVDEKSSFAKASGDKYEPIVTVSTKQHNGKVEISVKDNGNGIPDAIKEKIFQPFFTTKPTGQGTGLGLSLSYDIVKAHGGELNVETTEGKGTSFVILLPV